MNDFSTYIEALAANQAKSTELYTAYLSSAGQRTSEAFSTLTENTRAHFETLAKVASLSEAFEAGVAFDSTVKSTMKDLFDNNVTATKSFAEEIAQVYSPAADKAA
ncbi:MAG: hypothetical protein V7708_17925 [Oceanicoccus sp.]